MFDKQLIRKNIIIVICIIAIILAIMLIRRTFSRYESQADSEIEAGLTFWVVNDSFQEDAVYIGDMEPGEQRDIEFSVSNYNDSISSKVPIEYSAIVNTTTNMPLEYEIYKRVDGNDEKCDISEEIYQDDDGTYYKKMETQNFELGFVKEDSDKETQNFVLKIIFPSYNEDGLNDGNADDDNWQFSDLLEYVKISIDARQKVEV